MPALADHLHVDIERARQLFLRYPTIERAHDHVVFLDRRQPVDPLVVGEGLVVVGDNARGLGRTQKPQAIQPHVSVEEKVAATFLARDRQRLAKTDFRYTCPGTQKGRGGKGPVSPCRPVWWPDTLT